MNKDTRYTLIKNLVTARSAGVVHASTAEVEEEKKLALVANDDNSIADEAAHELASKRLMRALDAKAEMQRESADDGVLSREQRELLQKETGRKYSGIILKKQLVETGVEVVE